LHLVDLLSHYLESRHAVRLLEQHPGGVGYLLKERVSDVAVLTDARGRVHQDECELDPTIIARLIKRPRPTGPSPRSWPRADPTRRIRDRRFLSMKTVEAHVKYIFTKLGLEASPDDHWPVLAVVAYLRASTR
jgi:hypothetical protein